MSVACTFFLNRENVSTLVCPGFGSVLAFSGMGKYVDDPDATALPQKGRRHLACEEDNRSEPANSPDCAAYRRRHKCADDRPNAYATAGFPE